MKKLKSIYIEKDLKELEIKRPRQRNGNNGEEFEWLHMEWAQNNFHESNSQVKRKLKNKKLYC